jgi:Heavy metal binding domain
MTYRTVLIAACLLTLASCRPAESPVTSVPAPDAGLAASDGEVFFCPMDLDVRSNTPGSCPRCGMALVAGLPEPRDYDLDLQLTPRIPRAGETTTLRFTIRDPWEGHVVSDFEIMHEKLIHTFVVSQDLEYFAHVHPTQTSDGSFLLDVDFPQPGLYQVLGDFYPVGGTPQLVTHSVIVPGGELEPATLEPDYTRPVEAENITVRLVTNPAVPLAGQEAELYFTITPEEGLEKYIGAWGHMLAVSDDMIDTIHGHPFIADGSGEMLFHLLFPRARTYRVWVQFQRNGVVNTVQFDIPVEELTL